MNQELIEEYFNELETKAYEYAESIIDFSDKPIEEFIDVMDTISTDYLQGAIAGMETIIDLLKSNQVYREPIVDNRLIEFELPIYDIINKPQSKPILDEVKLSLVIYDLIDKINKEKI